MRKKTKETILATWNRSRSMAELRAFIAARHSKLAEGEL